VSFAATMIARPEIELGEVKGLEVSRPKTEITDEHVESGLQRLREENASLQNIEGRGAQEGDVLNAELQVYIDGTPKGEEPGKRRASALGGGGFGPAIEEHLMGGELDEGRRFNVASPSDRDDRELAGQAAEVAVRVTAINGRMLPGLDEE